MRHTKALLPTFGALLLVLGGGAAQAQVFLDTDWLLHRGTRQRVGSNNSDQPPQTRKGRVYVWPPTADMPGEIVADNTTLPAPMFPVDAGGNLTRWDLSTQPAPPYDRQFGVRGNWFYPDTADRGPGAWPPSDQDPNRLGDYVYTDARHSPVLESVGLDTLDKLPNLGADLEDPVPGGNKNLYRIIHEELLTDHTFARWTFGSRYPPGTRQGRRLVEGQNLAPNQRYAIFIRFPSSSTIVNGVARPNADHVLVRVSWGDDPNDPITSRIFLLNFGQTGGFWQRIRTGPGDDRYFPYDGDHPITVTLYSLTPDRQPNEFGVNSVIVADAVRLVPEALRGDIHAPASSALFPPGGGPGSVQLTYFGRDETTGPAKLFPTLADPGSLNGFTPIPLNPTRPPQADPMLPGYNPYVADPSSSIRSAVFYCLEDDVVNRQYFAKLRWRYVARSTPVATTTVDDSAGPPGFVSTFPDLVPGDQSYGGFYRRANATPPLGIPAMTNWLAVPPAGTSASTTYSVYVWIPSGSDGGPPYARRARYQINTSSGLLDIYLDQRNTDNTAPGQPRVGTWRRLASGVRFPSGVYNGNPVPTLLNLSLSSASAEDFSNGRVVVADAVQFVPESQSSNSVVAAPLIANVTWPSGTVRQVVYFVTTDGRIWALDALGAGANSTLTTAYWVYPSISNPDPNDARHDGVALDFNGPEDDPNYADGTANSDKQGIDGDLRRTQVGTPPRDVYSVVNKTPELGAFNSSPIYVEVVRGAVRVPYIVVGNQNGRVYAFDPAGRVDPVTNEPFATTFAAGDNPGVPGTTRRLMTWPSTARDKWVIDTTGRPFSAIQDDPAKGAISASPAAPVDAMGSTDRVIVGAGDGRVYAVDMQVINDRISNANNNGAPRWQYPDSTRALDPIVQPGALTSTGRFIFTAGGRVYAINNPNNQAGGVADLEWVYPFTATPPGNPAPADRPRIDTLFTAPAWKDGLALNGGAGVVFIANTDGRVFALDDGNTNGGQEPAVLWTSRSYGPTRAGAVFVSALMPQQNFRDPGGAPATPGPAVLLPIDTGAIIAYSVNTGRLFWGFPDSNLGGVPLTALDANGNSTLVPFFTSTAGRPGDGITANNWVYSGDEGNQDTGEMNGQMRAYADEAIGLITPDEPDVRPDINNAVDLRLVELFDGASDSPAGPWDQFGDPDPMDAVSPYHAWAQNQRKPNTQGNVVIYEWGDSIRVAAWGAYTGTVLPTVTFRLTGGATARPPVTVGALRDVGYQGPALTIDGLPAEPWVAKYTFPLGRGSEADPQTPGTRYFVTAQAQVSTPGGATFPTGQLASGQATVTPADPNPPPNQDINDATEARQMVVAHPVALTTGGLSQPALVGPTAFNIIGWTTNIPANNSATNFTEVVANGNRRVDPNTLVAVGAKDLAAPVGLASHGSSIAYTGVDASGNRVPALFIADRSNLWKLNQPLNNVRVARLDMKWGWNPNDASLTALQRATGNVMNPLPWETFPTDANNASLDYPPIARSRVSFRGGGIDLSSRGISLPRPEIDGAGIKRLQPLALDLLVDVPQFQPANVNRNYFDINGAAVANFLAPMTVSTGQPATTGPLISPSAGYVGSYLIFLDSNGDGNYTGSGTGEGGQQATLTNREEVFRQLNVGVAVAPDLNIRTEEETVDLGNVSHSLGFTPNTPFAPSGVGPYNGNSPLGYLSPWDTAGQSVYFQPFTVKNHGNVNLVNVRVAKVIGDPQNPQFNLQNPRFWLRLASDQVEALTNVPIYAVPYNFAALAAQGAVGNIGFVTSLDHGNSATNFEIDYNARYGVDNFWPLPNPYVSAGNALGWPAGEQPRPTLHKSRVGDSAPTVLSVPDVAYGDPLAYLTQLRQGAGGVPGRDVKPKIGVAVPLGTPVGTYSAPIYVFEDHVPDQWRQWVAFYQAQNGGVNPLATAVNDDGILNTDVEIVNGVPTPIFPPVETAVGNPVNLKLTVRETRLTNELSAASGVTPAGSFRQIDARAGNQPAFGTNIQPAALRDKGTGNVLLFWASDRQNNFLPAVQTPDAPWYLFFTKLNAVIGDVPPYGPIFDWRFETGNTRWWDPLAAQAQYPGGGATVNLFPRQSSDVVGNPNTPVVPGEINPLTERHASPALAQDDDPNKPAPPVWLFWQGFVLKSAGMGGQSSALDTRTFYTRLDANGVPDQSLNNGLPFSFLNDPALPKFAPKPIIFTGLNGNVQTFLFWYGGPRGRTKLYYNAHAGDLTDLTQWTRDRELATPGTLQSVSDPVPIHRYVLNPNGQFEDVIDLIYTGVLANRRQAETLLTRYAIRPNGRLVVQRLPQVDNELLARDGATHTWVSRDLAWVYRGPNGELVDGNGNPFFVIRVNGNQVNLGQPIFDRATGKLYFNSALGGQLVVDPQAGTVTFPNVAPRPADRVTATYIPQTMRLNVTRGESGAVTVPAGWANDAGFAPRPHVAAPGSNMRPVAFIDRSANPRPENILGLPGNGIVPVTRLWTFYRKSDTNTAAPSSIYYKTLRLMVRLPRGVLRSPVGGVLSPRPHVRITGNRGPVEIDWVRGRLYFTEADEGSLVTVEFDYERLGNGNVLTVPATQYRVNWGDEISAAVQPGDQPVSETVLPTGATVNEGQVSAFKDPYQDKVWVFWASTRAGTSDLYYMALSPPFYPQEVR